MSPLTPRTWATFIGPNQCYESKFGEINFPYSNFQVLPSSGLLAAFLVLEFKVNTFSILLGPNDPKKVKKLQKSYTIVSLAFDLAFTTFLAFFGLFISFWHLLMSNKSVRFICSRYLHSRTFCTKKSQPSHSDHTWNTLQFRIIDQDNLIYFQHLFHPGCPY